MELDRESVTKALQWKTVMATDREKIVVRARRSSSDEDAHTRPSSQKPAWNQVSPVGFTSNSGTNPAADVTDEGSTHSEWRRDDGDQKPESDSTGAEFR